MKLKYHLLLVIISTSLLSYADWKKDINFSGPSPFIYQPPQSYQTAYKAYGLTEAQKATLVEPYHIVDKRYRDASMRDSLLKSITSINFSKVINGVSVVIGTDIASMGHAAKLTFDFLKAWITDRWHRSLPSYAPQLTKNEWLSYFLNVKQEQLFDNCVAGLSKEFRMERLQDYYLHIFPGYRELIQTFPEYEDFMTDLRLKNVMGLHNYILEGYAPEEKIGVVQKVIYQEMDSVQQEKCKREVALNFESKVTEQDRKNIIENNIDDKTKRDDLVEHKQELADRIAQDVGANTSDYKVRLHDAIELFVQDHDRKSEDQRFKIGKEEAALLLEHGVPVEFFCHINGNQLQITLHKELLYLLEQAKNIDDKETRNLLVEGTIIGAEANKQGQLPIATRVTDFCYQILDYARVGKDFCVGVGKGAWNSVCNLAHAVAHPIETVRNMKHGFIALEQDVRPFLLLRARIYWHKKLMDVALLCGKMEYVAQLANAIHKDEIMFEQMINEAIQRRIDIFLQMSAKEKGERLGRVAMDTYLFGRISSLMAKAARVTKVRVTATLQKTKKLEGAALITKEAPLELVFDPKTNSYSIASETSATGSAGIQTPAVGKVPAIANGWVKVPEYKWPIPISAAQSLLQIRPYVETLLQEAPGLAEGFKLTRTGFGNFATKYVKLDLEHVLAPDFNVPKNGIVSISGFHHDMDGIIEKSGLVQFTIITTDNFGCYKADLVFNGEPTPDKTFFPQSWSQEKVISKIFEAYDNFKSSGATGAIELPNGKLKFSAYTNDGIKIEFYMTKNAEITTCYPLL